MIKYPYLFEFAIPGGEIRMDIKYYKLDLENSIRKMDEYQPIVANFKMEGLIPFIQTCMLFILLQYALVFIILLF